MYHVAAACLDHDVETPPLGFVEEKDPQHLGEGAVPSEDRVLLQVSGHPY